MTTIKTDQIVKDAAGTMLLNMGPSHPAMHGIVRSSWNQRGNRSKERMLKSAIFTGASKKNRERATYTQVIPYTDRLNYVSPMINNFGYAMAVEKLLGPEDHGPLQLHSCHFQRDLSRRRSFDLCRGIRNGIGCDDRFLFADAARELLYELIEDACGARVTVCYACIGGLKADVPPHFHERCLARLKTRHLLKECDGLLTKNRIFLDRMQGRKN
jgi:NADH-quinone oxidoreductase subunit D